MKNLFIARNFLLYIKPHIDNHKGEGYAIATKLSFVYLLTQILPVIIVCIVEGVILFAFELSILPLIEPQIVC